MNGLLFVLQNYTIYEKTSHVVTYIFILILMIHLQYEHLSDKKPKLKPAIHGSIR